MKNALLVLMAIFGWINVSNAQFGGAVLENLKKKTTDKITRSGNLHNTSLQ